jgi:hypothetical protein
MPDRTVRHNGIPEHSPLCDCLDCRTASEDDEIRQAKPATDEERAAFMGAEFPRVGAQA